MEPTERGVPDGGDDRCERPTLHDKDDIALRWALFAFALRAEGHEDDKERLHAHGGDTAVEACLRPTLWTVVLGVN